MQNGSATFYNNLEISYKIKSLAIWSINGACRYLPNGFENLWLYTFIISLFIVAKTRTNQDVPAYVNNKQTDPHTHTCTHIYKGIFSAK